MAEDLDIDETDLRELCDANNSQSHGKTATAPLNSPPKNEENKVEISDEELKIYYQNFFPFQNFMGWLGKSETNYFSKREFSFTLRNGAYFRYQSFKAVDELKSKMIDKIPEKIDIGAVYSIAPEMIRTRGEKSLPEERELVFDIDMNDYDNNRTCCTGPVNCDKCWKYMILAYKILDSCLREDFGFEHILYAFS